MSRHDMYDRYPPSNCGGFLYDGMTGTGTGLGQGVGPGIDWNGNGTAGRRRGGFRSTSYLP